VPGRAAPIDLSKLRSVYETLGSRMQVSKRDTELTGPLALAAVMMLCPKRNLPHGVAPA
jgi:hypothetical protein